ncbi:MAG: DUF2196 domain-containing protein [Candidatus Lokiarchaeota archaeon]|nr:DUF2196 domain-containing protein [Candidatus Lokiarchaeota archaeon]
MARKSYAKKYSKTKKNRKRGKKSKRSKKTESNRYSKKRKSSKDPINRADKHDFRVRANIEVGCLVEIEESRYLPDLTKGKVKQILTNKPTHEFGIKVKLDSGQVGRVKKII